MPKVIRVHLTDEQRDALNERARARTLAPRLRERLEMVRLSDLGQTIPQIARVAAPPPQWCRRVREASSTSLSCSWPRRRGTMQSGCRWEIKPQSRQRRPSSLCSIPLPTPVLVNNRLPICSVLGRRYWCRQRGSPSAVASVCSVLAFLLAAPYKCGS